MFAKIKVAGIIQILEDLDDIEEVQRIFKGEIYLEVPVCGVKRRSKEAKGTAWWYEEEKRAVNQKKKAHLELSSSGGNEDQRQQKWRHRMVRREKQSEQ